jgi:hypothetical protein
MSALGQMTDIASRQRHVRLSLAGSTGRRNRAVVILAHHAVLRRHAYPEWVPVVCCALWQKRLTEKLENVLLNLDQPLLARLQVTTMRRS